MNTIFFAGVSLADFGVFFDASRTFRKPAKRFTSYDIPNRNGDLMQSMHKFDNVTMEYNCYIKDNFKDNYSNLINFLNSFDTYQRLETSTEMEIYRLAVFHADISVNTGQFLRDGQFTLSFDCKPQQFLKSGEDEIAIVSPSTINNPTYMASKPIFKLDNETSIILNGETVITYPSVLAVTDKTVSGQGYQIKASNNVFTYSGTVPSGAYDFPCTLLPEGTYNFFGNSNIINCSLVINNGTNRIIYSGHTFTIADDDVSMSVRIHGGTSGAYTIKPVVTLGAVYVDCELMDCYLEDGTNANPYVQLTDGFITIPRGVSVLETDRTQFLVATVKPRWWRL